MDKDNENEKVDIHFKIPDSKNALKSEVNYGQINNNDDIKINSLDLEELVVTDKKFDNKSKTKSKKSKKISKKSLVKFNFNKHNNSYDTNEKRKEIDNDPVLSKFDINLLKYADEIFDMYIENEKKENAEKEKEGNKDNKENEDNKDNKNNENNNNEENKENNLIDQVDKISLYELQNLMDVLGIKKNEFEINSSIKKLKQEKPKTYSQDEKYSKENLIDIVRSFLEYRIEDKILVEVFRKIDVQQNGYLNISKLKAINESKLLNFSEEEMLDILYFFNMEEYMENKLKGVQNIDENEMKFDFQKFSKLYYQGA